MSREIERQRRSLKAPIIIGTILLTTIALVIVASSVVVIQAGHRGVLLTWGQVEERILGEGLHFITPIAQRVEVIEVRTLAHGANATAASKDLQDVQTNVVVNYRLDATRANLLYKTLGDRQSIEIKIIEPTIQEAVKASMAKFTAEQLITARETAKQTISEHIKQTLADRNIFAETVYITNFEFSPEFSRSIEAKVVAEQNFLREQNVLKSIEVQAQQREAQAIGEGAYIETISKTIRDNPEYLQWYSIARWDGKLPIYLGSGAMPFIDLTKARQAE